ncbi:hypothetical protein [Burkholderia sp. 22PA0106]|uniref:hypothetical protein n=1 Tax=Burkholderia sp. 22PA0106 TaxID=3237371 RepID=UPI0039C29942
MNTDHTMHATLARSLRILGYGVLAAIVLALFVAMCAILHDGELNREIARGSATDTPELHSGTGSSPDVAPESAAAKSPG